MSTPQIPEFGLTPDESFVWHNAREHSLRWIADKLKVHTTTAEQYYVAASQKVTHMLAAEVKRVEEPYKLLTYLEAEAFCYRGASRGDWIAQALRLGVSEHEFAKALSRAVLKIYDMNGPNVTPPETREKGDAHNYEH